MNDQEFKKLFSTHKVDIPDNGFSDRITGMLPDRKGRLPQIIMVAAVLLGLGLMFAILGFNTLPEQIHHLVVSVTRVQMPSLSSIITYLSIPATTWIIGYSITRTAEY
jgi:hypothetical protein